MMHHPSNAPLRGPHLRSAPPIRRRQTQIQLGAPSHETLFDSALDRRGRLTARTAQAAPMASHFAADAPHLASCRRSAPEDRRSHPSGEALPTAPLAASAAPDFRPKAKGDPFDVRTEPTVPKPRCVIEAIEPM